MNTNETTNSISGLTPEQLKELLKNSSFAELQNILSAVKQQADEKKQNVQSVIAEHEEKTRYEMQNCILVVLNTLPDEYRQLIKSIEYNNKSEAVLINYVNTNKNTSAPDENCSKVTLQFEDGKVYEFHSHVDVVNHYQYVGKLATYDLRYNKDLREFMYDKGLRIYTLSYTGYDDVYDVKAKTRKQVKK